MVRTLRLALATTLLVALVPAPAAAYKRLVEREGFLVRPAFGLVTGFGSYSPGSGGGAEPQLSAGLRYLRPDVDDALYHSVGFELLASTWSSSTADIFTAQASVLLFWKRTSAFTFDHHFWAGAGVGTSQVDRSGTLPDLSLATGSVEGGLQGRVRDWYLEGRLKYIFGPNSAAF